MSRKSTNGQPSEYEQNAIVAIHAWKNPDLTWWDSAMRTINRPIEYAGEKAMQVPGVNFVVEKAFGGVLGLLNDGAAMSVRPEACFTEFQPVVACLEDIHDLELASVDRSIGFLATKYKALALTQGAAAGAAIGMGPAAGAVAITADVTALLALNLRAIGEYATYCGFDVSNQEERLFALNVLALASSPDDAAKVVAMAQLVKIAQQVAKKKAWKELERSVFVRIIQRIAKALTERLTRAKLGQLLPVAGVAIGGGFNAYYTSQVCDAAFFLYRERFLARKFGADVIEITVDPGPDDDFAANYETE